MEARQEPEWLTVRTTAKVIEASSSFVLKLIHAGKLKASNIGMGGERAEWRIRRTDLEAFMSAAGEAKL